MPLINYKVELSLKWNENCILSSEDGNSAVAITNTKLYFLMLTLSPEPNIKLGKLLGKGFKRPVYWNQYKVIPSKTYDVNGYIRELLDSSYQGIKR